jgi:hypothetical protein
MAAFTKVADTSRIEVRLAMLWVAVERGKEYFRVSGKADKSTGALMPATGELIRAMNYVDDITATVRRLCLYIPSMNKEERQRLAEYLRAAGGVVNAAIADLDKVVP